MLRRRQAAADAVLRVVRHVADVGSRAFARGAPDATPAKAAKGGRQKGGGERNQPNVLQRALMPAQVEKVPASAEQLQADAARAKEYSRKKMAQHRAQQVDLGVKLRMRMAALEALPEELRAAASEPDYSLFPPHRTIPMETAPVPGYFESLRAAAEEVVSSSALGGGKRR